MNNIEKVKQFMTESGQLVNEKPTLVGGSSLRYHLMREENEEYIDALVDDDLVEILDACVDMAYILYGTILTHGLQDVFQEAFDRVHENNMSKRPFIKDNNGKIIKPLGFKSVNLKDLVK